MTRWTAAGARPACYLDVYFNGIPVYNSTGGGPLFDINSVSPDQLEAVEVYTGGAQVPARFNRTSGGCGVLVLWSRVSH